jgi:hypothetical protein
MFQNLSDETVSLKRNLFVGGAVADQKLSPRAAPGVQHGQPAPPRLRNQHQSQEVSLPSHSYSLYSYNRYGMASVRDLVVSFHFRFVNTAPVLLGLLFYIVADP